MDTQTFKKDATNPAIGANVSGFDENPVGRAATFYMRTQDDYFGGETEDPKINGETADISDVTDNGDGTFDFIISYQWQDGDLDTAGEYFGEFKIVLASTTVKLPFEENIPISVIEDVE